MLNNEPLVKHGYIIIFFCLAAYWGLSEYLKIYFAED
jgi:hypothetical protein